MANISQIKLPDNTVYDIKDAGALRTITSSNVTTALGYTPLNSTLKGANNGVAELDANGKVPSSQLPSYVDDVLEYAKLSSFPTTGETGKIYIAQDTNKTYRWSGTAYTEISSSLALGTTSSTAYRGDYGNAAYTHAVTNKGSAFASGLYKITTNSEGHVTAATAIAKADITALGIPESNTDTHRPIQVNGTQILGNNTTALNLKAGTNVNISNDSGTVTISATDTNTWRGISDSVSSTSSDVSASSKAVKTAYDLASGALPKTGGTLTGALTIQNNTTSCQVLLDNNEAGTHGILSQGYWDGSSYVSDRKWIAYRGLNGDIYLNGTANKATQDSDGNTISSTYLKTTGDGTIEGKLIAKKAGDAYMQAYNSNTGIRVYLDSDTSGTHGIWSNGYYSDSSFINSGKWLIKRDTSGSAVIDLNLKLTSPLGVAYGGTGATNKWSALNNLGIDVGFTDVTTAAEYTTLPFSDKRYFIISAWFYNQNTTAIPYVNNYGSWVVYFYNQTLNKKSTTGRLYYAYIDTGSNQFTDEEVN